MEMSTPKFRDLFEQLGLDSDDESIARFIERHRPLPGGMLLQDAPFWTGPQSALLQQKLRQDAEWAELIDQLNVALR